MKHLFWQLTVTYKIGLAIIKGDGLVRILEILTEVFPVADYIAWVTDLYLRSDSTSETIKAYSVTIKFYGDGRVNTNNVIPQPSHK